MKWMKANFIKSPRSMNRYIMNTSKSGEKTILSNSIKTEHSFTQQIFIENYCEDLMRLISNACHMVTLVKGSIPVISKVFLRSIESVWKNCLEPGREFA